MTTWVSTSLSKACVLFLNISFMLLFCFFFKSHFHSSDSSVYSSLSGSVITEEQDDCQGLQKLKDYKQKCLYIKSQSSCDTNGFIDYLYMFYCIIGGFPLLGYTLFFLWLMVLFYLLGNTASVYFCSSLESLSKVLRLSPTMAGVTLLSLGNGTPDVFAILVSFVGNGSRNVGVNSMLGGAFFVSCIVVGIIGILIGSNWTFIAIDKSDFVRDVCFLLLVLSAILVMVIVGKVNLWSAIGFISLYVIYVLAVYIMHIYWRSDAGQCTNSIGLDCDNGDDLEVPILPYYEKEVIIRTGSDVEANGSVKGRRSCFGWFLYCLNLPLYLPRRLTIPVVSEDRWSKPYAVASVTFAPILLAVICNSWDGFGPYARFDIYVFGGIMGVSFGALALVATVSSNPPKSFLFLWLVGGFIMSVTWSYITANELVSLLVSIGRVLGISSSILGLTVLAWGNSLGDLITNVAMAVNGGPEGTQVAISGCYAGPIFNILVGLGLSLVLSTWYAYPFSVVIARDPFLLETLAFLVMGLLWALVVLPMRKMKPDRLLGVGLLAIYMGSISLRLFQTLETSSSP